MRILLTGGAGFIGSHLSDKLLFLNHEVFIIDDLSSGSMYNLQSECRKNLFRHDICDKYYMSKVFEQVKPDIVYHLAAQINVRKSIQDPILDAEINTIGTLNILNECVKNNVKKVIFSSSGGAIYQDNQEIIKTENSIIQPTSPYGISKYTAEQYINFYKNIYGLDGTILRFSNVYGPRQGGGESGVLSIFINNLLNNKPLTVFGDGEQTRDYVNVYDVADALLLAADVSGTYNVSTGIATSLNDLIKIINQYLPCDNVIYSDAIPGELKHNCLSNSLLKSKGWANNYSLEQGIKETIQYFKEKSNATV